jgi:hypothetical protein
MIKGSSAEALEPLYLLSCVVVLERAWSNFSVLSTVRSPDPDDEPASASQSRRTRVTPQLRAEVVRRYQAGDPSRVVAEELGIGKATVLKLIKQQGLSLRPVGVRY